MAKRTDIKASLDLDTSGLKSGLSESEGMLAGFGGKAQTALLGVGVVAAAGFAKGFLDGMNQQEIAGKFGADIAEQSATVYRNAWGESLEDVATQMRDVEAGFGSDANLEVLTENAFILAEKFDKDVGGVIQDVSELTKSFGLEGEEAFDLWATALGGMTSEAQEELSAATREYGDYFADLGYSADETLALFKDFGEDGAIALDKVGDAVKELTIRGTDMSTSSVEAYDAMGLSAEGMAEMFLAGGDEAKAAMQITVASLQSIEDPVEQAAAAVALFGTPIEDLGVAQIPQFLDSLTNMGAGMEVTEGITAALGAELGDNLGTKLETLKREGLGVLADFMEQRVIPVVENVIDVVVEHWPQIQATIVEVTTAIGAVIDEYWPTIKAVIQTVTEAISELVEEHWPQVQEIITDVMETVSALIERYTAIIQGIWERWGEEITEVAERYWDYVKDQISAVLDIIQGVFRTFKALFEGDWSAMWDGIKQVVDGAKQLILNAVGLIWDGIKAAVPIAWDLIKQAVVAAIEAFPGAMAALGGLLLRAGRGLFFKARDGMIEALEIAWNWIKDWVTGLPGDILGLVVDMVGVGRDLFDLFVTGVGQALAAVPGLIAELVTGPIEDAAGSLADLLNKIPGVSIGGLGDVVTNQVNEAKAQEAALLAASSYVNPDQSTPIFHSGGMVTQSMAQGYPWLENDEVQAIVQVGEEIVPKGGSSRGDVNVYVETNAEPWAIGAALHWELRMAG